MKYIVVLGDGMADEPVPELDGKTPLEAAATPAMDRLAGISRMGMVRTVPVGMAPGSDTANLSVLGYDPATYYSGRSPLEALSIGAPMGEGDVALRCNLVTLSDEGEFAQKRMIDHSAGEIPTDEAAILLDAVRERLERGPFHFYAGVSYRHCLIWERGKVLPLTAPHDILGQTVGPWLPKGEPLLGMTLESYRILSNHPLNRERGRRGELPANCCWFWGAGTRPALTSFLRKYGKKGMMVSAVDLLRGIAVGTGMSIARVEGATGGLDTNYEGKRDAALRAVLEEGYDFAYLHIEAPDEMGHQGSAERKITSIQRIDSRIVGPLVERMDASGQPWRLLVLPDHPTPVERRTHTADPVPFLLYDSRCPVAGDGGRAYNERQARATGDMVESGTALMEQFLFDIETEMTSKREKE